VCPRRPLTAIGCVPALLLRQFIATMTKLDHPEVIDAQNGHDEKCSVAPIKRPPRADRLRIG
jgi:hypothetical protein